MKAFCGQNIEFAYILVMLHTTTTLFTLVHTCINKHWKELKKKVQLLSLEAN